MLPRDTAGGVIIGPNSTIVLVWQNKNSWSLPKGGINEGETIIDAAWREVHEETGLGPPELVLVGRLGSLVRRSIAKDGIGEDMNRPPSLRTYFLFTSSTEDTKPLDDEVTEMRWLSIDEAIALLSHPKDKEFLSSVRSKIEEMLPNALH